MMTTLVEARPARSVGLSSFAHLTDATVLAIVREGVLFDGNLTPEEVGAVWWFLTSRDDADETARRNLAALRDVVTADPSLENVAALAIATTAYLLGET